MTLQDLKKRFIWTKDTRLDTWRILKGDGPLRGDCDDFAMTALYVHCNQSILKFWFMVLTFQGVFWFVKDPNGQAHLALWVRGKGWIDNWYPEFYPELRHTKRYPALFTVVALRLFLGLFTKPH